MRAVAVMALAACGRVAFDPLAAGDAGSDGAGGDVQSATCQSYSAWGMPTELTQYTSASNDWEPAVSPDGQWLVFGRNGTSLHIAPRSGNGFGATRSVSELDMVGLDLSVTWAFEGDEIIYSRSPTSTLTDLALWRAVFANGVFTNPTEIAELVSANAHGTALSPDGLELYLGSNAGNVYQLHRAVRATKASPWVQMGVEPGLAVAGAQTGWPSMSSDGLTLYYEILNTAGEAYLYMATRSTTADRFASPQPVTIAGLSWEMGDPDLSVDGLTMHFAAMPVSGTNFDLYVTTRTCLD